MSVEIQDYPKIIHDLVLEIANTRDEIHSTEIKEDLLESHLAVTIDGKNSEARKALLLQALHQDTTYQALQARKRELRFKLYQLEAQAEYQKNCFTVSKLQLQYQTALCKVD